MEEEAEEEEEEVEEEGEEEEEADPEKEVWRGMAGGGGVIVCADAALPSFCTAPLAPDSFCTVVGKLLDETEAEVEAEAEEAEAEAEEEIDAEADVEAGAAEDCTLLSLAVRAASFITVSEVLDWL